MLVRQPDQCGAELAHSQLAFAVRLVELAEPNRHVAANDDLQAAGVARRRNKPGPGKQFGHAGVNQHAPIGMVDDMHVDRHPLALGEQVGNEDWRDGNRGGAGHSSLPLACLQSVW